MSWNINLENEEVIISLIVAEQAALDSAINALNSENAAAGFASDALASKNAAAQSETNAAGSASTATEQAGIAAAQAGISTTQAGIATSKASEAEAAKDYLENQLFHYISDDSISVRVGIGTQILVSESTSGYPSVILSLST